ncbi:MAG TPA: TldD/PmbA family protein [Thermoplasmata archaeon]|nr:TldD/PmbA family protein [Thermoplasmata archaeon]
MTTLLDSEGGLETALRRLEGKGEYADVLAEASDGLRVRVEKTLVQPVQSPSLRGAVFRAWTGERWAETVARTLDAAELTRAADHLLAELAHAPAHRRPPPGAAPTGRLEAHTTARRAITDVPIDELLQIARGWFGRATEVPGISNAFASAGYLSNDRLFRASTGARRFQSIQRVIGTVVPLALENGKVEYDAVAEGSTGGSELFDRFTDEAIREASKVAVELLGAGEPPRGQRTVVLDPSTSGTFAHESFGHGTEADQLVRDRSYLRPLLGNELAPEALTLVDDGSFAGAWGSIYFDDEGTPARRTVLVDKGRFTEVLHDRETAAELGRTPGGNARRADFLSRSFVRMTNTFVEPGEWGLDEMLDEARDGILLERCTSGIEDPLGGQMQIKVKRARKIEHGKLTERYSSMALSGKVLEFLRTIRAVGRREQFEMSPGFCGKGHTDILPAGTGGTYLLGEAVVGPA